MSIRIFSLQGKLFPSTNKQIAICSVKGMCKNDFHTYGVVHGTLNLANLTNFVTCCRSFPKNCNALGKFCQNRYGKTKKNRELGVLISGIKRDGHQKNPRELGNPGIRSSGN